MGKRNAPDAKDARRVSSGLRILLKFNERDKLRLSRKIAADSCILKLREEIETLKARPKANWAQADQLWREIEELVAKFLSVYFEPEYRRLQIQRLEDRIKMRETKIRQNAHRENIRRLRSGLGLAHLGRIRPILKKRR